MEEYVQHPFGDKSLVELEERPAQLLMATRNNVGKNISVELRGLGFVPKGERERDLVLMDTPEKILGKDWALSRPKREEGKKQDPNLFTIYLNHGGGVGHMDFLRQISTQEGGYRIFFP